MGKQGDKEDNFFLLPIPNAVRTAGAWLPGNPHIAHCLPNALRTAGADKRS
ncbi:hypothetical protein [Tolypothrix sp. VBCCA 56010]|uniref:hypothetical protein n=1 Tax=Tolypothrix sp. VBCCA 56010 TaxID=3137731 RepID=UPI003D7EB1A2